MAVIQDPYVSEQAGVTITVAAPTGLTATDTPNVTAAITKLGTALASGPATLKFQDGTYQVDGNSAVIQSVSNFTVTSNGGTVIEQAPNRAALPLNITGDLFVIADCTDFTVSNLKFDGRRDTIAPITPLSATAASGQPSVTVASGASASYLVGERLNVYGGLGSADQNNADNNMLIQSISPGGGSGGGDLITFTANLAHTYNQTNSTLLSDGYGPYACDGDYVTPYQTAYNNSVAGRTLGSEDQQNGLHLLNCQRFTITGVTARNLWESGVKCGTGFATTSLTDGCSQGDITDCIAYHLYDQGISVWISQNINVKGCVCNAAGWAGVSLTISDYCTAIGNQILNSVYRVPTDSAGSGIATEGGLRNQIKGNIIESPFYYGVWMIHAPQHFGLNATSLPTTSTFLEGATAAGTSIQVSSSTTMEVGGLYSLLDGYRTESVTVATIIDGTHVTFDETLMFSHASGIFVGIRIPQENVIEGNTIRSPGLHGIESFPAVRSIIKDNTITNGGGYGIAMSSTTGFVPGTAIWYPAGDGSIVEGNVIGETVQNCIFADAVSHVRVAGNFLSGPSVTGSSIIQLDGVSDSVISGNTISDNVFTVGMATSLGVNSAPTTRLVIENNTITRCAGAGMYLVNSTHLVIRGNNVTSCAGDAGIDLMGCAYSTVSGNITNSNQVAGVKLEDHSSTYCLYNTISGNIARDDASGYNVATGATWTQASGIVEAGNSNDNLFLGNECDSNSSAQLTVIGAGSVSHYNIISGTISA